MKKTIVTLAVLAALGVLAPTVYANSFIIDEFNAPGFTGQSVSVTGVGSQYNMATGLSGVVGNSRSLQMTVGTSSYTNTSSLIVHPTATGSISLNNGSGNNGVGTVVWDANGTGLGGLDLTSGGILSHLQATILSSDMNIIFRFDITETAATGGSTAYWTAPLGPGISFVNQALSSFTNAGAVDFTQVNKMWMTLSGPSAQDTTLDLLEVTSSPLTPEPATLSLLALGGLAMLRRRKNKK